MGGASYLRRRPRDGLLSQVLAFFIEVASSQICPQASGEHESSLSMLSRAQKDSATKSRNLSSSEWRARKLDFDAIPSAERFCVPRHEICPQAAANVRHVGGTTKRCGRKTFFQP